MCKVRCIEQRCVVCNKVHSQKWKTRPCISTRNLHSCSRKNIVTETQDVEIMDCYYCTRTYVDVLLQDMLLEDNNDADVDASNENGEKNDIDADAGTKTDKNNNAAEAKSIEDKGKALDADEETQSTLTAKRIAL